MSEHIRPEFLQIPHEDIEVQLVIAGYDKVFSTADTAYWIYPERYAMFNHISKWEEDGTYSIFYDCSQEEYDALHEAGITQITPPYPTEDVVSQFWAVEMAHYDQEIEEIESGTELM